MLGAPFSVEILALNYLQLPNSEVRGILLYQGIPRPILSTKHPERSECFPENFAERVVIIHNCHKGC